MPYRLRESSASPLTDAAIKHAIINLVRRHGTQAAFQMAADLAAPPGSRNPRLRLRALAGRSRDPRVKADMLRRQQLEYRDGDVIPLRKPLHQPEGNVWCPVCGQPGLGPGAQECVYCSWVPTHVGEGRSHHRGDPVRAKLELRRRRALGGW